MLLNESMMRVFNVRFGRCVACSLGLVVLLMLGSAHANDAWLTSYGDALEMAEDTGRPVLTIFTGSDWCPHCRTLEDNVLETNAFLDWAEDNVVLLTIDLPQHGISHAVRSERSQVCIKYGVRTFPSALLIDSDGEQIVVKKGYRGQSASTWVSEMAVHVPRHFVKQTTTAADASNASLLK